MHIEVADPPEPDLTLAQDPIALIPDLERLTLLIETTTDPITTIIRTTDPPTEATDRVPTIEATAIDLPLTTEVAAAVAADLPLTVAEAELRAAADPLLEVADPLLGAVVDLEVALVEAAEETKLPARLKYHY